MPCTQTHMPTCMPIHSRTRHMFTCPLYAHMRTHIHMPTCMPIHSHTRHAFTCPLYTHMCTHIHMHTRLHTHSFTAPALGPGALTLPSQGLAISSSCGGRQFEMEPGFARWHTPPTTHASEPPEPACSGRSAPQVRPEERGFLSAQKCSPATSTLLLSCLEGLTGAPTHQRCACCPGGGRWSSIPSLAEQTDGKLGSAVSGLDFPPGQVQVSEQNTQPPRPPDMQLVELFLRLK